VTANQYPEGGEGRITFMSTATGPGVSAFTPNTKTTDAPDLVYPNPFGNDLNAVFSLPTDQTVRVQLTDLMGKTLYSSEMDAFSGRNELALTGLNELPAGNYVLTIMSEEIQLVERVARF